MSLIRLTCMVLQWHQTLSCVDGHSMAGWWFVIRNQRFLAVQRKHMPSELLWTLFLLFAAGHPICSHYPTPRLIYKKDMDTPIFLGWGSIFISVPFTMLCFFRPPCRLNRRRKPPHKLSNNQHQWWSLLPNWFRPESLEELTTWHNRTTCTKEAANKFSDWTTRKPIQHFARKHLCLAKVLFSTAVYTHTHLTGGSVHQSIALVPTAELFRWKGHGPSVHCTRVKDNINNYNMYSLSYNIDL